MSAISVQLASNEDIPALVKLMQEFYAESDFELDRVEATETFSMLLGNPAWGAAWILHHEREPAGFAVLSIRFSMEHGGLEGIIDDLFVSPQHRRQALARSALKALFQECDRRRVRAVRVEVGRENMAAQALYRRFGLQPCEDGRLVLTGPVGHPRSPLRTAWYAHPGDPHPGQEPQ